MHSSRMHTARSCSRPGAGVSLHQEPPWQQAPPLPRSRHPPWTRHHPQTRHPTPGSDTPPRDQTSPPWTKFLTHTSQNITLPQTSFAGGKNFFSHFIRFQSNTGILTRSKKACSKSTRDKRSSCHPR